MFESELEEAVRETTEQMLFEEFNPAGVLASPPDGEAYWMRVDISTPRSFVFHLAIGPESARYFAGFLLGEDRIQANDALVLDFVSELGNNIAGALVRLLSDDSPLDLSPPTSRRGSLIDRPQLTRFGNEEHSFYIGLELYPGALDWAKVSGN